MNFNRAPVRILFVLGVLIASQIVSAEAQAQSFSYPVGLDPAGDNWVALRSLPSAREGARLARLGPDALFVELGRSGEWVNVRLPDGRTGWISARFIGCCRTVSVAPPATPAPTNPSCDDLWYERNAIFKVAGFCFRSPRGVSAFGNEGCKYDDEADVPLTAHQRADIAALRQQEQRLGCPR